MWLLVTSKSDSFVLQKLIPDDVAECVIVVLDEDCRGVLLLGVVDASDQVAGCRGGRLVSSASAPTVEARALDADSTSETAVDRHGV